MIGEGLFVPDNLGSGGGAILRRDHERVGVAVEADVVEEVEVVLISICGLLRGQTDGERGRLHQRRHDRGGFFSSLVRKVGWSQYQTGR